MGSNSPEKPHAVVVPYPSQGHISPMLKLAKLLHSGGFYVTFVNTEFNHDRLLRSQGPAALAGLPDFRYESIPDGLPPSDPNATQDVWALCSSISVNFLSPFLQLLGKLGSPSSGNPPVTVIVSDAMMSFCIDAGRNLAIPVTVFWTASACGLMGYLQFSELRRRGIVPFKDESYLENGFLDTPVDWIDPTMKNIRFKDLPSFLRTTDHNDVFFNFLDNSARRAAEADSVIINTFDELELTILRSLSASFPPIYTIGPIHLLSRRFPPSPLLRSHGSNLWKEEGDCIAWLDSRGPRSVVFVNFGSIAVMTAGQLSEFAWGLAGSGYDFLWVIRADLLMGTAAEGLPPEFVEETRGRGLMVGWCTQEEVLSHPAIGAFLTHAGWNSMLESLAAGVPVMCWPFFAEQTTNCRYAATEWGVGMEIESNVRREEVRRSVRELMAGEKGKEMRRKAAEWKESAARATDNGGTSIVNFVKVLSQLKVG
ncbi:hypothetical protein HPP92_015848 [Vanilla planifolia]|uniref:Glycosyltransferase n=1 Tax=Vanilla planifolia TaxID=51239 RepID=A0A835U5X1_VANPL|nr:hypothetical protein HPP92_027245 [Vanilla planifolia]KAG0471302.1 hypothetical protein HPP92_015848 [Vanilla planifolia]